MTKRDVLDKDLARRFAWRAAEPAALEEPQTAPSPEAPPPSPEDAALAEEKRREDARYAEERCKLLAEEIRRAWEIQSQPEQAAAARKVLRGALRLSFYIVRMEDHPIEAIRLWRLVIRHLSTADGAAHRRTRTGMFGLGFMPLSTRPREIVDLLVEAAEKGSSQITFLLDQHFKENEMSRHPELGERLAHLVDTARTWEARVRAARWLSLGEFPAAIPALRRALRMRHLRLRHHAIFILSQMKGPALTEEDVLWLLQDAVIHPMSQQADYERVHDYEEVLVEAVKLVRPAGGHRPLEVIVQGGGALIDRDRGGLDRGWALRTLAAGYPERALPFIDRCLFSVYSWNRRPALEALAFVADSEARPRLMEAAASPDLHVAEGAREQWFKRFGQECPVGPLACVPAGLLEGPPSEQLVSRLSVLRGKSDDARKAMTAVILAEAPEEGAPPASLSAAQREALALLICTLTFGSSTYGQDGLPSSDDAWVKALLGRFGAPAFEALAATAERPSLVGADSPWLGALSSADRSGLLTADQKEQVRSMAVRALGAPGWNGGTAPLMALRALGAPPEAEDRLWDVLLESCAAAEDEPDPLRHCRYWATEALETLPASPTLDARAAGAAEAAFARGDEDLFQYLMDLGGARRTAPVLAVATRAVDARDVRPEAVEMAHRAARALRNAGCIDSGWLLERLRDPELPAFGAVADLVDRAAPEEVVGALRAALESPARGGAAAAEAARCLVWKGDISTDDPRLAGIRERAPAKARADLAAAQIDLGAPLDGLRRDVAEALLSPDPRVTHELIEALYSKRPEGMDELFEELLPRVPAGDARGVMEHYLRAPTEASRYWVDAYQSDDEEDLEDDPLDEDDDDLD
jgi:hypothetical protein